MKQFKFFCNIRKIFEVGRKRITLSIETKDHVEKERILKGLSDLGLVAGHSRTNKNYVSIRIRNEEVKENGL